MDEQLIFSCFVTQVMSDQDFAAFVFLCWSCLLCTLRIMSTVKLRLVKYVVIFSNIGVIFRNMVYFWHVVEYVKDLKS